MRGRLAVAIVLLIGSTHSTFALDPHKRVSQFGHQVWTSQQGLPQDSVRAIAQARDDALWIGTDEGLARFDGTEFTRFAKGDAGLPNGSITALAASRDGSIWVGTLAGISHYQDRAFHNFDRTAGLGTESISGLLETADGTLWAAGGRVVSAIRSGQITNYGIAEGVPSEGIRELIQTKEGAVWGAGIGVVVRFEGGRFRSVAGGPSMMGNIALAITEDREGTVWIAGTKGVASVRPDGRARMYGEQDGLPENLVRAVQADRDGNLWVGTVNGLARLDGDRFVAAQAPGLSPIIWDLFEDHDGSLWVGTNAGLHQFRDQAVSVYGTLEGFPSDQPSAVYQQPDGTLWIGFRDAGVVRLSHGDLTRFTQRDGLAANEVFAVRGSGDGDVLVGTRLGLTIIHDGRLTTVHPTDPLERHMVYDVIADGEGRRWLATHNGVIQLDGNRQTRIVPGGTILSSAVVALARTPDGTMWAGTYGEGLWEYRNGNARRLTMRDGLSSDAIRTLVADPQGVLWIGTAGGGLAWHRNGRFGSWSARDGLESDNVGQIVDDGAGRLWLGTTVGLAGVDKRQLLEAPAGPHAPHRFIASDGLRSSHCAPGFPVAGGGTRDRDGRIWVVTANGLASVQPDATRLLPTAGATVITGLLVDGQPVTTGATRPMGPTELGNVVLAADARQVEFRFASTSLAAPERLRYRFQLEGLDSGWTDAGEHRFAEYSRLPPGSYRFVVAASISPGTFGQPGSLSFTRQAHWSESRWFPYAIAAVAGLAASLLYVTRLRQVRARFRAVLAERNRISRELHDTLAQGFVGIASQLSSVAGMLRDDPGAADERLALARKMTQYSLTEARRSIMDLRSSALDGRDLIGALEHVTREMTAGAGLIVDVTGDPALRLGKEAEQQLLRIAQEAVANAMKHARPQRIGIDLRHADGRTWLTIRDDGVGFDPARSFASARGHFGLLGMRERARRLGGDLRIESAPGAGTIIQVDVAGS